MSRYIDPRTNGSRSTNHSSEIEVLRAHATEASTPLESVMLNTAADLLEAHDSTGLSLDEWEHPRALVERALVMVGLPRSALLNNGV